MRQISRSIDDTYKIAKKFLSDLVQQKRSRAILVTLKGDLGSSKTTFVKACGRAMKVKGSVVSPTFVIMRQYPISFRGLKNLIHIDFYRISDREGGKEMDLWQYIDDPANIIFIEWSDNNHFLLKADARLSFEHKSPTSRIIEIA